jgi:hypothetical protein
VAFQASVVQTRAGTGYGKNFGSESLREIKIVVARTSGTDPASIFSFAEKMRGLWSSLNLVQIF